MLRIVRALLVVVLGSSLSTVALAIDPTMVPKVMSGLPVGDGSWQMEMLEGAQAAEMRKNFPNGMKVCTTAAKAMAQDLRKTPVPEAAETDDDCDTKIIENSAKRMVTESRCKNQPLTRVTMTRPGPKSIEMVTETVQGGKTDANKMRMTYLGTCSASDGVISGAKDSEMCKSLRQQMGQMNPATQCANAGAAKAACEQQLKSALTQMEAMCK